MAELICIEGQEIESVEETQSDAVKQLTKDLDETTAKLQEINDYESQFLNEDLIVQEREWLQRKIEESRKAEDKEREELFEKQKILNEMRRDQNEYFAQSKEMQTYNKMHEEEQRDLVYALHGVSVDKYEGMKEYKNALYQGAQISLSIINLGLCVAAAFMFGYASVIFITFVALFASQITLLPREHHGKLNNSLYSIVSKILSFMSTPFMAAVLICEYTGIFDVDLMIGICASAVIVFSLFGCLDYYVRNPYREARSQCRAAKNDLKKLKINAVKTVKKNQKLRVKLENKLLKRKEKQESKLDKLKEKEELKFNKSKSREEEKAEKIRVKLEKEKERKDKYEEILAIKKENRNKRKELINLKIIDFKEKLEKIKNKKEIENTPEGLPEDDSESETASKCI